MHADPDTGTADVAAPHGTADTTHGDDDRVPVPQLSRGVIVFALGMMAFSFVPWGIALVLIATGALGDGNGERIFIGSLFVLSQLAWSLGLFYGGAKYVKWWRARRRRRRAAAGEVAT